MIQNKVSRLDQFQKQIADENVNREVVRALGAIKPLRGRQSLDDTVVALVGGLEVIEDFDNYVSVVRLRRSDWKRQLADRRPDIVVIESNYACVDSWRTDFLENIHDNQLVELAAHCKAISLPCALWVTLERGQIGLVGHLLDAVQFVFAAEQGSYDQLHAQYGDKVSRLMPFVDMRRFNPAMPAPDPLGIRRGSMPVVSDCLASIMYHDPEGALLGILQRAMGYNTFLYETQDGVRPRESYMPAHMLRRSLGTLTRHDASMILKVADVSLVLENTHRRSSWCHHRKILEAMASKCLPISAAVDTRMFGNALAPVITRFLCAETPDEVEAKLDLLLGRRLLRERLQHLLFRETLTSHALDARLREMDIATGYRRQPLAPWLPKVSVILVTNRPENLSYALRRYRDQTYVNKELILVVNTDESLLGPLRRQLRESDNARIIGVPARWPIGVCLNAGISLAEGEFWAKFDDDDIYGPAYLSDYVLNASFVDFDICGKANVFTFDERADRTFLRRSSDQPHTEGSAFAGGTLFVRNRSDLVFREDARGFVDIWFQWQNLAEGKLLYATDPFNFMQVRRADRRTHTWRIEVAEMGDAEDVGPGLALEAAFA